MILNNQLNSFIFLSSFLKSSNSSTNIFLIFLRFRSLLFLFNSLNIPLKCLMTLLIIALNSSMLFAKYIRNGKSNIRSFSINSFSLLLLIFANLNQCFLNRMILLKICS
ncbi:hypothetical protein D8M05_11315 [Oceanobacillus bengalensis]|uniref:Uncharacterized protein n=1 Tax=Oceanobacillus bengalensis TaxID=1435466 RepID=A0A494YXY6_9BACI|nr:hypothetical protein D8M05_11315 [Oceanobacillus bengalensis]